MKKLIRHYVWMLVKHVLDRMQLSSLPYPAFAARQTGIRRHISELKQELAHIAPQHPALRGFKVYSQADEDGIIDYLLSRLPEGMATRKFIEIGCGDGLENNSHYLLLQGYSGVWVDGSAENIARIRSQLGDFDGKRLLVASSFIDLDNIDALTAEWVAFLGGAELDFLSVDIDGNDAYIVAAMLRQVQPRLVCVEYNAKFPPSLAINTAYDKQRAWSGDDYHGASLRHFCDMLGGYTLVACCLAGTNAFFVRNDLAPLYPRHSVDVLYQPFRAELCLLQPGHPASLAWLRDALRPD